MSAIPVPVPLEGDAFKQAVRTLAEEIRQKITNVQQGVPTFGDNALLGLIAQVEQLHPTLPWEQSVTRVSGATGEQLKSGLQLLHRYVTRRAQGRFVEFPQRLYQTPQGLVADADVGMFDLVMSQGMTDCLHWKGQPLFKSTYDFAIYTMLLWELKPRTIIELGSGSGTSAIWLADTTEAMDLDAKIYSIDIKRPDVNYDGVQFIQGDSHHLEAALSDDLLKQSPHPWLVIEDAHVNVGGVLSFFHPHTQAGDYLFVEDSNQKGNELAVFLQQHPGNYKVDTRFTDFFGRNATSARDSIFVKI